jgi:hypothetical protein
VLRLGLSGEEWKERSGDGGGGASSEDILGREGDDGREEVDLRRKRLKKRGRRRGRFSAAWSSGWWAFNVVSQLGRSGQSEYVEEARLWDGWKSSGGGPKFNTDRMSLYSAPMLFDTFTCAPKKKRMLPCSISGQMNKKFQKGVPSDR